VWRGGWGWTALGSVLVVAGALYWIWLEQGFLAWKSLPTGAPVVHQMITDRTAEWVGRTRPPGVVGGIVFGDSVFARGETPLFAPALEAVLARRGVHADLLDLSYRGLGAFQFYYALRPALAGRPRFAIIEVNVRTFAEDWATGGLRAAQMSARLSLSQILRIRHALATQSLSVLAPFTYRLEEATGMLFLCDGLRHYGSTVLEDAGTRVNAMLGLTQGPPAQRTAQLYPRSLDASNARAWYAQDFADTPTADALRALVADLHAADVTVRLVVAPINTARLAALGVAIQDLERRLGQLRDGVGARADEWVETSQLVSPADFTDAIHVKTEALERVAELVADRLGEIPPGRQVDRPSS
jgi:hypothetical protein